MPAKPTPILVVDDTGMGLVVDDIGQASAMTGAGETAVREAIASGDMLPGGWFADLAHAKQSRPPGFFKGRKRKPVTIDGKTYESASKAARATGQSEATIRKKARADGA